MCKNHTQFLYFFSHSSFHIFVYFKKMQNILICIQGFSTHVSSFKSHMNLVTCCCFFHTAWETGIHTVVSSKWKALLPVQKKGTVLFTNNPRPWKKHVASNIFCNENFCNEYVVNLQLKISITNGIKATMLV